MIHTLRFLAVVLLLFSSFPAATLAQTLLWGSAQRIERNIAPPGMSSDLYPSVAMHGNNVAAAWRQSDGTTLRVYSNSSLDGGVTWQNAQLIENYSGRAAFGVNVGIVANDVVAVWEQYSPNKYYQFVSDPS